MFRLFNREKYFFLIKFLLRPSLARGYDDHRDSLCVVLGPLCLSAAVMGISMFPSSCCCLGVVIPRGMVIRETGHR